MVCLVGLDGKLCMTETASYHVYIPSTNSVGTLMHFCNNNFGELVYFRERKLCGMRVSFKFIVDVIFFSLSPSYLHGSSHCSMWIPPKYLIIKVPTTTGMYLAPC